MPVNHKKRQQCHLTLPPAMLKRIEQLRKKRGWNRAQFIRAAIDEYASKEERANG